MTCNYIWQRNDADESKGRHDISARRRERPDIDGECRLLLAQKMQVPDTLSPIANANHSQRKQAIVFPSFFTPGSLSQMNVLYSGANVFLLIKAAHLRAKCVKRSSPI